MNITILADASYCHKEKVGGYGYWIASQRGKLGGHGAFRGVVEDNITAEMMALVNALHIAVQRRLVLDGDSILFQSDCVPALWAFTGQRGFEFLKPQERSAHEALESLRSKFDLAFEFRHVKGHSNDPDSRFVANNLCDKRAKRGLEYARRMKMCQKLKEIIDGN